MLALDENRDFGTVGDRDDEPLPAQLTDMRDLIKRDRSHPSVMAWSFCNEGECSVPADSNPFRQTSYDFDGTREVTQNYLGEYKGDGENLDIQGFSHKNGNIFDTFHAAHPTQPMMATECCSCMSQRGVDTDACPDPKDGGCVGYEKAGLPDGTFYNNNIGKCTADQVLYSDSRDFVTGTFVWSGFDCESRRRC
jgi:beta-galactosidase/beta-glucuronidase